GRPRRWVTWGSSLDNSILVIPVGRSVRSGRTPAQGAETMKLSYSAISTYELCPAKYRFQYEDRLPTSTSPALSFGDSLHRTLHRFHDRPVPVAPSLNELQEMLQGEWVSDGYRDPSEEETYLRHARHVLS